jgi:hypothetical protein
MLRSTALLLFVSGAVLACSEEEPSARKSLGGVEGQSQLNELNDAQFDAVCNAAGDKLEATFENDDLLRGACLLGAHVRAQGAAMVTEEDETAICEETYDACVEMPFENENACEDGVRSGCTASVNDFDRCLTLAEELYRELSESDCEEVSEDDSETLDMRIQASANACDLLIGCFGEEPPDAGAPDSGEPDGGDEDSGVEDDDAGM